MMADIPEYKSRTRIEPAPILDAASAYAPSARAWEGIGQLGANIAQEAANKRAALEGAEAAKTPGRMLMPGITESTKSFNEAYLAQEYAIATNNAAKTMQKLALDVRKNPTPQGLIEFEKQWEKTSADLLESVNAETRAKLEPQLRADFDLTTYKIQNSLLDKEIKFEEQNFERATDKTVKSIQDLTIQGQYTKAEELKKKYKEYLDSDYVKARYSPAYIAATKEMLDKAQTQAKWLEEAQRFGLVPGVLEEKLRELSTLEPTEDNLKKAEIYTKAMQQRDTLKSATDSILLDKLEQKAVTVGLDPADIFNAKSQLSAKDFAAFELRYTKMQQKQNEENALFASIDRAKDDPTLPALMATMSSDKLNKFLKSRSQVRAESLGIPDDLFNQIDTAKGYPATFSDINNQANAIIRSGNPNYAPLVIDKIIQAQDKANPGYNPHTFAGLSKESQAVIEAYKGAILARHTPEDAFNLANNNVFNVKPEEIEARKRIADENLSPGGKFDMSTTELATRNAAKAIGLPTNLPINPALALQFERDLRQNAKFAATFDQAVQMTADNLRGIWGVTHVNGEPEVTDYPVENYVTGGDQVIDAIRMQAVEQFRMQTAIQKDLFEAYQKDKTQPQQNYYYEITTHIPSEKLDKELIEQLKQPLENVPTHAAPFGALGPARITDFGTRKVEYNGKTYYQFEAPEGPAYVPLKPGEPRLPEIKIRQVWADGTVKEGTLVIQSDNQSPPPAGQNPSYFIGMEVNGVVFPILNPIDMKQGIRFVPDTREILDLNNEFKGKTRLEIFEILEKRRKEKLPKREAIESALYPLGYTGVENE